MTDREDYFIEQQPEKAFVVRTPEQELALIARQAERAETADHDREEPSED